MSSPALELNNVSFRYPGAAEDSLRDLSLKVERGSFLAITGSNGNGKTTLCKLLVGLIPNYIQGKTEGSVFVNGKDALAQSIGELARQVGFVCQDFENQVLCPSVLQEVAYGPVNYGLANYGELRDKAIEDCGLAEFRDSYVWQLSGGRVHLLALAGTLALTPDILVIDEPTSQLDAGNAEMVYSVLRRMNREEGKTVLVIEHNPDIIARYCTACVKMEGGRLAWSDTAENGAARLNAEYPPFQKRQRSGEEPGGDVLLELRDLWAGYRDLKEEPVPVLNDFSLTLREGERVAVTAGNGAGKTTLLKALAGQLKEVSGSFIWKGEALDYPAWKKRVRGRAAYVPQNPALSFLKDSVEKDISFAMGSAADGAKVRELLENFGLSRLSGRDGRLLSGGQMRKAAIAIGAAQSPRLLLLDEPTSGLDAASRRSVMEILMKLSDPGMACVIATHDRAIAESWADREIALDRQDS